MKTIKFLKYNINLKPFIIALILIEFISISLLMGSSQLFTEKSVLTVTNSDLQPLSSTMPEAASLKTPATTGQTAAYIRAATSHRPEYIKELIREARERREALHPLSPTPIPTPVMPKSTFTLAPSNDNINVVYPITNFSRLEPSVALTFDDGYDRPSIERTLASLRKAKVKCTFFVIGECLKSNSDLWRQALKDGHQICNHTLTHPWLTDLTDDGVRNELSGWENAAKEVLGTDYFNNMKKSFPYMRLPGNAGFRSPRVLKVVAEKGYTPVSWDIETFSSILKYHNLYNEPSMPIAEKVASYVVPNTQGGSIILFHFNIFDTLKLDEIISGIKKKGLTFKLLSEVLKR